MQNVVLAVSQRTNIDLTLNVAVLEQQMTIVEAAPTLETGGSAIGTTVAGQYTRDMPLYGRSYFGLVFLSGGITESAGSGMWDNYPSGTDFVSNGQRNSTAEVRFDGAPISAPEQGEGGNSNVLLHAFGGSDPGIQGREQQLLGRVRKQRRYSHQHHDEAGRQPASRQWLVSRPARRV
jgi:hypothetical protein